MNGVTVVPDIPGEHPSQQKNGQKVNLIAKPPQLP